MTADIYSQSPARPRPYCGSGMVLRTALAAALAVIAAGSARAKDAAVHGEEIAPAAAHDAAAPVKATPTAVPLPPRPSEYPKGLSQKAPAAPPPPPDKAQPGHPDAPATAHKVEQQEMPPPIEPGPGKPKPETGDAKAADTKPMQSKVDDAKPGVPRDSAKDGMANSPGGWVPPKRYHFLSDLYTGLAIGGIDPVAYFVDGAVRAGVAEHELDWGGTTWHFVNEGNLAAFRLNPEVYAPKFGARCAYAMAQGISAEGRPEYFAIHRDRLYLFANAANRTAFLANPDALAAEADRVWPGLMRFEPDTFRPAGDSVRILLETSSEPRSRN